MELNKTLGATNSAKDFFLNLGAIVAFYTTIISLINLLFTVINYAYPQITNVAGGAYVTSQSISIPVSVLIIFFPIFILLMWLLERDYRQFPEKRNYFVKRGLTYLTLFIAGIALAIDLVTIIYYFIDGRELTGGFLLKFLAVLVVSSGFFIFYISDVRNKLTTISRKYWLIGSVIVILASIVWGFAVLGSPRTQRLYKYDEQKINDLQNINYYVEDYYQRYASLPSTLSDLIQKGNYAVPVDSQTGAQYEYILVGQSAKAYQLCATFNLATPKNLTDYPYNQMWTHPAGRYCFNESIPVGQYAPVPKAIMAQ